MEVELIYNVVLISAVQQSEVVIHTQTLFKNFFFIIVYHRALNTVLCALHQGLMFIPSMYNSLHLPNLNLLFHPFSDPSPLEATSLFSLCMSLFLFYRSVLLCHMCFFISIILMLILKVCLHFLNQNLWYPCSGLKACCMRRKKKLSLIFTAGTLQIG